MKRGNISKHIALFLLCSCSSLNAIYDKDPKLGGEDISASAIGSQDSKLKFECVVKNSQEDCKRWIANNPNLQLEQQPFVVIKAICRAQEQRACEALAKHPDFDGTDGEKRDLFQAACDGGRQTACEPAKQIAQQINAEKLKREYEERLERARLAKEELESRKRLEAEEKAEKRRADLEKARLAKIDSLKSKCESGSANACLNLASGFGKDDINSAWDYFKKACEMGSTRTCQTIAKSALKRDDTSEAIFAYSHLCEKDIAGSCDTLIELRRLKSENDGRSAQLELMQRQAESTRALQMQQLEATMATQRMEAMRTMLQGFQRAFQPVPVAPIVPSFQIKQPTRCTSRRNILGEIETECRDGF
jgi:hypothetical protein